jgi:hypothetical protein
VYEQSADAELLRGGHGPDHRVTQEKRPEASSLSGSVDGKPREQNDRDGMARHPPGSASSRVIMLDRPGGECVIRHDASLDGVVNDVRPRRAGSHRLSRVVAQPGVERRLAAAEIFERVPGVERRWIAESRHRYWGRGR